MDTVESSQRTIKNYTKLVDTRSLLHRWAGCINQVKPWGTKEEPWCNGELNKKNSARDELST